MTERWRIGLVVGLCAMMAVDIARGDEEAILFYVGTYTRENSKGVYLVRLDPRTGQLSEPRLAGEVKNPSFVAIHPNGRFLYAVSEVSDTDGKPMGGVVAFAIDPATHMLSRLNHQPSGGKGPCYVAVDASGRCVGVANYGSGSIATLPLAADGTLREPGSVVQHEGSSVNPKRQEGPHAHSFYFDPSNRFVLACDLGIDKVMIYRVDLDRGTLGASDPPSGSVAPGGGPRHLAFGRDGRFVYVINEMGNTISAFAWDGERGSMREVQTVGTLPDDFSGENTTAEVVVHPSGKFLYASNRGHDSIAIFTVEETSGKLSPRGHVSTQGKTPRNFNIDPSGQFIVAANQNTHNIVVFRIDEATGALEPTGGSAEVGSPVCIRFIEE